MSKPSTTGSKRIGSMTNKWMGHCEGFQGGRQCGNAIELAKIHTKGIGKGKKFNPIKPNKVKWII